jgi:fucose 4-O-acetylase-like acetyltransferase
MVVPERFLRHGQQPNFYVPLILILSFWITYVLVQVSSKTSGALPLLLHYES